MKLIYSIFIFLLPLSVVSQTDFGAWTGMKVHVPLNKKISFGTDVQTRYESNLSELSEFFISPYVSYELNKHIGIGADYRMTYYATKSNYGHREAIDLMFEKLIDLVYEKSRFDFSMRLRGTHEFNRSDDNSSNIRLKGKLSYNLRKTKLEPELSSEFFYHFNDQIVYQASEVITYNRFDKYRIRLGLNYSFSKRHRMKMFYQFQKAFLEDNSSNVLGLKYTYQFKTLMK